MFSLTRVFSCIGSFLLALLAGMSLGETRQKNKQLEAEVAAHEKRKKVEDNTVKLDAVKRRRVLKDKWSVRGVERNKADPK